MVAAGKRASERLGPVLETIPLFSGLPPEDRQRVLSAARMQRYGAGEVIFEQGDPPDRLFAVATGRLKVVAPRQGGRDATLNILGPGDVFGELSMLDEGTRTARVSALSESVLLVLGRADFMDLYRRSRTVADRITATLVGRLRSTVTHFEDTTALEVSARLAKKLLSLGEQYGQRDAEGALRLTLQLSQRDLGDLIDATRQTVNRLLRAWTADGVLRDDDDGLVLLDEAALQRVARG